MERQAKKEKAIELMKRLKIYEPYIQGFEQEDKVCFFEMFGGFWVYQEPEIEKKMKEIEAEYKCVVYAITHELRCVHMTYLQLSLAGVPAIVKHQDSLTRKLYSVWRTPAFVMQYPRFIKYG